MLIWSPNIYFDDTTSRRKKKYKKILEKDKSLQTVYCITLPSNGDNMMDIYSSRELWFQYYKKKEMVLIGLAVSREKAQELVAKICEDTWKREGDLSPSLIRNYFQPKA